MTYPYVAGAVLLASDLNTDFAAKYDTAPAINAQTGTTYTFVLADATAGKTITASNASASTYTVPPQSSVAFSAGALLRVTNLGAGVVTFAGGVGVTVTNTAGTLAQYQTATLVRTGADAWTVIPAGGASGLTLVATAAFSASSAVSVNSCFSATYDTYRLEMYLTASTTGLFGRMRLRVGGADASGANYDYQLCYASGSTVSAALSSAQTAFEWGIVSSANYSYFNADVFRPGLATATGFITAHAAPGIQLEQYAARHTLATAYDGLTIYPSSGTITGTLRVYGYKNS